jgi:adenosylcobinamide-GDP ribazoletransferase
MKGLITALRTLTIFPLPGREAQDLSRALPWFPLVGLLLGFILTALGILWSRLVSTDWPEGGAVLLLGAQILLTGGLHLDGLADWADAMGGPREKESRLTIMKDPRVGSFGVLALIMALLLKWVIYTRLIAKGHLIGLFPVLILSRAMMVELITTLPYARSGQGTAGPFVNGASPRHRWIALAIALCFCLCFGFAGLSLFFFGWGMTLVLGKSFKKGFGGITGDLLGTTNEILEILFLMIWALPERPIFHYIWSGLI